MGVDGLIVSDIGVISMFKKQGIKTPLHVSTQANTVSPQTVEVLKEIGAKRVNLARELSYEQIAQLQTAIQGKEIETEVFVHGSVCFSISGRCAISDYLTGRRANRGECTHPCRWQYHLVEEKRPGVYMPVAEDDRGLYFFNSKDLALFPYVRNLMHIGIDSLKIEGRMKSIHYLASVLSLYRKVMDGETVSEEEGMRLLGRVMNRGYSYGFMKGSIEPDDYKIEKSSPTSDSSFLGYITEDVIPGKSVMDIRNKTFAGDLVEVLRTDGTVTEAALPSVLVDVKNEETTHASHGKLLVLPLELPPYSIIRRTEEN
jgi:putative protease